MKSCREIDHLVTPYVDGEVAEPDRVEVEAHLTGCPPCHARAAVERTARHVLRSRKAQLTLGAPDHLRKRCRSVLFVSSPARSGSAFGRPHVWIPLSLAATVLLVAAGVLIQGFTTKLEASLAAQLALDHEKCFASASAPSAPADAMLLESSFESRFGWHVRVPDSSSDAHVRLLGGRRCTYVDGRMVHLMYDRDGRPVSLFVLPNVSYAARRFEVMGQHAILWVARGQTYALVGDAPNDAMEELVTYARRATQ